MTRQTDPTALPVTAVVLAGGMGRRMGGEDKGLITLKGHPLVEYALRALAPQVDGIIISANRNLERYSRYGYPVVSDTIGEYCGPLAGMAAAMAAAPAGWLVTAPCDSPLIPGDYVARMVEGLANDDAEIAVARDSERLQPVFALIPTQLQESLIRFLESGERKIDRWYGRHRYTEIDFSDRPSMFLNLNRPEEREALENALATP
ncbi:MAG: molybdenum cofactor guanylyltransferase [Gammaproteobacteria bacterium]